MNQYLGGQNPVDIKLHGYTRQKRVVDYLGEYFLGLFIECKGL